MPTRAFQLPQARTRRRLLRHRPARWGLAYLAALLLVSILTLPYSLRWFDVQDLDQAVRHGPEPSPVVSYAAYASALERTSASRAIAALAPALHHASSWLGHDDLGRSLLYRLMPGFLISLAIGVAAAAVSVVIGAGWGAIAALAGGRVDALMMRIVDVIYGLPYILMVILLKVALTAPLSVWFGGLSRYADLVVLFLAIGGVSWLTMARVVRGQVLSLRAQPFVEAARAIGAGPVRILTHHVLPNLAGPIVVYATLVVPQAILQESFLSFLGIGVQQPIPSLGRLAADGVQSVNTFVGFWWLILFPCAVLVTTLLALNFVGDGLRDALDPKSRAETPV